MDSAVCSRGRVGDKRRGGPLGQPGGDTRRLGMFGLNSAHTRGRNWGSLRGLPLLTLPALAEHLGAALPQL